MRLRFPRIFPKRKKHAARELPKSAGELTSAQQVGDGEVAVGASSGFDRKAARKMRHALQTKLKRRVILYEQRWFHRARRTAMKYRRPVFGLGLLGVSIASVATAGLPAAILGVIAAGVPGVDLTTFFDAEMVGSNPVVLTEGAVRVLLAIDDPESRAMAVQAAINNKRSTDPDALLTLSREDIERYTSARPLMQRFRIDSMRVGVRVGLAVIGSGLLLLALTIIPQDIHGLMTRAAAVILVVGAVIVGAAMMNSDWLKGISALDLVQVAMQRPASSAQRQARAAALDRASGDRHISTSGRRRR